MSRFVFVLLLIGVLACSNNEVNAPEVVIDNNASTLIINKNELELKPSEGLVYHKGKPFSGTEVTYYPNEIMASSMTYINGKKEGVFKKWFNNGLLSFESFYTNGKLHGTTTSWWRNGHKRSIANYENGKSHGQQLQWYKSGAKFKEINVVNGKEEGMQRAWRENGKIYNNYEAKNGRIFGLKRANLCYELEDEEVQYKKQ